MQRLTSAYRSTWWIPAKFDTLRLDVQYDDGFVAYLNGVEVARAKRTGYDQLELHDASEYRTTDRMKSTSLLISTCRVRSTCCRSVRTCWRFKC